MLPSYLQIRDTIFGQEDMASQASQRRYRRSYLEGDDESQANSRRREVNEKKDRADRLKTITQTEAAPLQIWDCSEASKG